MAIKVRALGEEVSLMRIGRRQLKVRGPRKRDKPLMVIKSKSVPSHTPYWLEAAIALAEAGISARGRSFEEVIATVIDRCAGRQYKPDEVRRMEKEARYRQADANLERMRRELAAKQGMSPGEYMAMRGLASL